MKQIIKPGKVLMIYDKEGKQVYSELTAGNINQLQGPFEVKAVEKHPAVLGYKTRRVVMDNNDKKVIYITAML